MRTLASIVLVLAAVSASFGQNSPKERQWKAQLPVDFASVVLISDPNSPIQLSGPTRIVGWSYGAVALSYQLQNVSKANVTSLRVEEIHWANRVGYGKSWDMPENIFWVPLMQISSEDSEYFEGLSTFDPKAPARRMPPKGAWLAMVVKAELSNGAKYDASQKFKELQEFIDKMTYDDDFDAGDRAEQMQRVIDFASALFRRKK
jgi:hypothetical protein